MPESKQEAIKAGTTPFPDLLLDRLMPRLRDTEWRLLCVVVRQTYGWVSSDGRPKQTDWLSHAQLRRKTGRSSAAISLAIDFLCRNGLVEIEDGQGLPLKTAFERRSHRGRLHFRVNPLVLSGERWPVRFKRRIQKVGMTTNTQYKKTVVVPTKKTLKNGNQHSAGIQSDWQGVGDELKRKSHRHPLSRHES